MPPKQGSAGLQSSVVDALGQEIVDGLVPAGHRYTLDELCERFGFSRTTARDASGVLEALGLLRPRRKVGLEVQPQSCWAVVHPRVVSLRLHGARADEAYSEIAELRAGVEPIAAASAAQRATPEDRAKLLAAAHALRDAATRRDVSAYRAAEQDFHSLLLSIGGNSLFGGMRGVITEVVLHRVGHRLTDEEAVRELVGAHMKLAEAIHEGRATDAARHARRAAGSLPDLPRTRLPAMDARDILG